MSADLFVVRHGIAHERDPERWPDDSQRPLTPKGEREVRAAARGLKSLTDPVATVLASPYPRAWRTAEILHEVAGWGKPRPCAPLEADGDAAEAIAAVAAQLNDGRIAIVGHEPMLSDLCGILLGGSVIELKKGAVARLSVREWRRAGATLRWLFPPKALRALGG